MDRPHHPPSGRWYWPGSTVVENDTLLVFAYWSVPAAGRPRSTSPSTARPSPSITCDLTLQGVTNLPGQQAPKVPYGDGPIPWGVRSERVDDGTVYLYGTTKRADLGLADVWVARAPFAQVTDPRAWQYLGVVATEAVQQGQIGYDARVANLTGAGWTAVYSVNGDPHNNENVRLYRGQFAPPNEGVLPAP